jgi:uncharacterized protein
LPFRTIGRVSGIAGPPEFFDEGDFGMTEAATDLFIGTSNGGARQVLNLRRANRHGLIAGATGTGKTVTLQGIVDGFSAVGVAARAAEIGQGDWAYRDNPVQFWDLFGEQGHPVRTTVSEMGPLLLSRLMDLNEVQEGVLTIAFHVADKDGLLLLDLDDLQSMLVHCGERADELTLEYGNITKQSVGTIQRALLQLRTQGGAHFFGEPALDLDDFLKVDDSGRGVVNILAADKLMASPKLYSTFLLWLLSELFEQLPEVGDPDKPKLVFFFDEAHLLFNDAPKALLEKIEQVVRLIRSKGVGVYFITQNPIDIPDTVAAQLNNRIQHKLNAFTPRDQQAVKAAAETFRPNPAIDVAQAITELKIGEALVSLLQPDGSPSMVERTLIKAPASRVGPLTAEERQVMITTDAIGDKYDTLIDRESAEELLSVRSQQAQAAAQEAQATSDAEKAAAAQARVDARTQAAAERERLRTERAAAREAAKPSLAEKAMTRAVTNAAGRIGSQVAGRVGGQLLRGLLGGLFR